MRIATCFFLQCICLCSVLAQTTETAVQKQPWRLHSVAISANLFPYFPEAPDRSIPTELPIGRFQPSVSLYKNNPDKWIELSLLVLRPGLSEKIIDTATVLSPVTALPVLAGSAGTFKTFHTAFGVSLGR